MNITKTDRAKSRPTLIGTPLSPGAKTADIIEKYVTKGKEIAVEGKLSTRAYDDKDGNKRYVTEVIVSEILLLGNNN